MSGILTTGMLIRPKDGFYVGTARYRARRTRRGTFEYQEWEPSGTRGRSIPILVQVQVGAAMSDARARPVYRWLSEGQVLKRLQNDWRSADGAEEPSQLVHLSDLARRWEIRRQSAHERVGSIDFPPPVRRQPRRQWRIGDVLVWEGIRGGPRGASGRIGPRLSEELPDRQSKYGRLTSEMRSRRWTNRSRLTLSFSEIEDILGGPLPSSARRPDRRWWANGRSVWQQAWQIAGWRVARNGVDWDSEMVTFIRRRRALGRSLNGGPQRGV
jgi:hypothetical protein